MLQVPGLVRLVTFWGIPALLPVEEIETGYKASCNSMHTGCKHMHIFQFCQSLWAEARDVLQNRRLVEEKPCLTWDFATGRMLIMLVEMLTGSKVRITRRMQLSALV